MNLKQTANCQEAHLSLSRRLRLGKYVKRLGLDHLHWHLTQPIYYVRQDYARPKKDFIICPFCRKRYEDD